MPFQSMDEDGSVVARLEMNVDQGQIDSTKQIAEIASQLSHAMEAITRFSGQHLDYLKQSADAQVAMNNVVQEEVRMKERQEQLDELEAIRKMKSKQEQVVEKQKAEDFANKVSRDASPEIQEQVFRRTM